MSDRFPVTVDLVRLTESSVPHVADALHDGGFHNVDGVEALLLDERGTAEQIEAALRVGATTWRCDDTSDPEGLDDVLGDMPGVWFKIAVEPAYEFVGTLDGVSILGPFGAAADADGNPMVNGSDVAALIEAGPDLDGILAQLRRLIVADHVEALDSYDGPFIVPDDMTHRRAEAGPIVARHYRRVQSHVDHVARWETWVAEAAAVDRTAVRRRILADARDALREARIEATRWRMIAARAAR